MNAQQETGPERAGRSTTRRGALVVAMLLVSLALSSSARAQRVDPGATPSLAASDRSAMLAIAGPRARVTIGEGERVRMLYGARVPARSGDPVRDAVAFVERFREVLGVPRGAELRVEPAQRWHGFTIVRLRRVAAERPVIGASVVVRLLEDGTIDLVLSDAGPARVEGGARIDASRAAELARDVETGWVIAATTAPSAVAMQVGDAIVPVWSIDLHGTSLSQRMRALLDARDGRVLAVSELGRDSIARVFATNPTSTMGMTSDVDLAHLTSAARLTGRYFRVASCNAQTSGGCSSVQLAEADADGNFLSDPDAAAFDDAFAEANAYHHLDRAAAYFRDTHAFTWSCGGSSVMQVTVNYTERPRIAYDNAAFYPASGGSCGQLLFGQGATSDYAYDADVVVHELGHAVTDQIASLEGFLSDTLGVSYEPLALNEGTSDYWASTLQGDPNIAESFARDAMGDEGSLRVIDNDLTCPTSLFGEGHYDGRIWAGTAWELRETLGAEPVDALVFATVASMTDDLSLADAGDLLVATAMGMVSLGTLSAAEAATVEAVVTARGLPGCVRVVPLDDGELREGWSGNELQTGSVGESIAPLHYRIDVPADARSLTLSVGQVASGGDYALHVRTTQPVQVSGSRVVSDARLELGPGSDVRLDARSDFALPRCETLFVAIESNDLRTAGQSVYSIQATMDRSGSPGATCPVRGADAGPGMPDAGMVVADDAGAATDAGAEASGSSGCGCRVGRATVDSRGALALVTLAGVCAFRRRRRSA